VGCWRSAEAQVNATIKVSEPHTPIQPFDELHHGIPSFDEINSFAESIPRSIRFAVSILEAEHDAGGQRKAAAKCEINFPGSARYGPGALRSGHRQQDERCEHRTGRQSADDQIFRCRGHLGR